MTNETILQRSDEADKYLVYAKLDNAKVLHQLVKAVSFKDVIFHLILTYPDELNVFQFKLGIYLFLIKQACGSLCPGNWFEN